MTERIDEWPRVHTCLYNWCPKQREECNKCNQIITILSADKKKPEATFNNFDDMMKWLNN